MPEDRRDDVMSRLLELQARLREQPPDDVVRLPSSEQADPELPTEDSISVSEPDLWITETPSSEPELASVTRLPTAAAEERVAELSARLKRLESELSTVITKIDQTDGPRTVRPNGDVNLVSLQSEIANKLDDRDVNLVSLQSEIANKLDDRDVNLVRLQSEIANKLDDER